MLSRQTVDEKSSISETREGGGGGRTFQLLLTGLSLRVYSENILQIYKILKVK